METDFPSLTPDPSVEADFEMALSLLQNQQYREAVKAFDAILRISPHHAPAWFQRGNALYVLQSLDDALESYRKAASLKAADADLYNNFGVLLRHFRRLEEALAALDQAVLLRPAYAEAHNNRALVLSESNQFSDALKGFNQALALKPDYPAAYNNRGNALLAMKRAADALRDYERAISFSPSYAEAHHNRALALKGLRRHAEAIASYDVALKLIPAYPFVPGARLHQKLQICDWDHFEQERTSIILRARNGERVLAPMESLALVERLSDQRKVSEIWAAAKSAPAARTVSPPATDKIRVGYFSPDFREHAVSYLTAGLFEAHDRSAFETTAFAFGPAADGDMRKRLEAAFDTFIDVGHMTDLEIVKLARARGIDIAVDLAGYTQDCRTGIFAGRAAPVQINYLGFPGTMGVPYIDYIVADNAVIPEKSRDLYSEKVIWLPHFQANDTTRPIADATRTRTDWGLPEQGFVFCCFNNNNKITPPVFESWMRILQCVERSVLFLYADHERAVANLKSAAAAHGVDPNRVICGGRLSRQDYLARFRATDLFLDTLPFNAGTTASDALWAGVPVLTMAGETFAGRMGAGILRAAGLPELIVENRQAYEDLAVEIALNLGRHESIKQTLARNRVTMPLFNIEAFTRTLEEAYRRIVARYRDGLDPTHIVI
jgi:predicted O-linked N-acetylglucosamine transferase (SPINDLY family)